MTLKPHYAKNTKAAYRSALKTFQTWLRQRGKTLEAAEPGDICDYLEQNAERNAAMATIELHRAAIAAACRDPEDEKPNPAHSAAVKRCVKRLAASLGKRQRQAAPLTATNLEAIRRTARIPRISVKGVMESDARAALRGQTDIALAAAMRDGLLRASEAAALTWADLQREPDGSARILIRRSKTDQQGAGRRLYLSPETAQDIAALRQLRPTAREEDPIFNLTTATAVANRLKKAAKHAGIEVNISGHSPRVGMAQDLAAAGAGLPALMTAGRWKKPEMPARYIENIDAGRGAVAQYHSARQNQ